MNCITTLYSLNPVSIPLTDDVNTYSDISFSSCMVNQSLIEEENLMRFDDLGDIDNMDYMDDDIEISDMKKMTNSIPMIIKNDHSFYYKVGDKMYKFGPFRGPCESNKTHDLIAWKCGNHDFKMGRYTSSSYLFKFSSFIPFKAFIDRKFNILYGNAPNKFALLVDLYYTYDYISEIRRTSGKQENIYGIDTGEYNYKGVFWDNESKLWTYHVPGLPVQPNPMKFKYKEDAAIAYNDVAYTIKKYGYMNYFICPIKKRYPIKYSINDDIEEGVVI